MLTRRSFIGTAAATLAMPAVANAQFKLDPKYVPQYVRVRADLAPGQIIVLQKARFLYHIEEPGKALRYGISVGRAGLEFSGTAVIQVKKEWPTWRPTNDMIEREPHTYARFVDNDYVQPGGPGNPLGSRALYLFQNGRDTFARIHGTDAVQSIGRAASNGCFRMANDHVAALYERVPIGTTVTVI
ncbi:L,D-transpeptidase [Marinovum sp. 2_MG-2023]|uniref:L,D-transpeptidase n=1 Tax=unclassified Marinovum TaxID=2647166 RepID=UPI0026E40E49|nr:MULTISPECIES: L,D-transpeptidase [unclassified Marinovum]MDO6730812.1 L,D-transpeptidase [Marinovum sp. 2_MG-2023]MDO6779983.1 L,D-transpeptidase [Marinovum sp. 1_MG-2023]